MGNNESGRWLVIGLGITAALAGFLVLGTSTIGLPNSAPRASGRDARFGSDRFADSELLDEVERRGTGFESSADIEREPESDSRVTRIIGTFVDAETGVPVPSMSVRLDGWVRDETEAATFDEWRRPDPVFSDSFGRFELETVVRSGYSYALIAQREGYGRVASRCDGLRVGQTEDYGVIEVRPEQWVETAVVVDEHGSPKRDYPFVVNVGASPFGSSRNHGYHTHYGVVFRTDGQGAVHFDLPAKSIQIRSSLDPREHWFDRDARDGSLGVQLLTDAIRVRVEIDADLESIRSRLTLRVRDSGGLGIRSLGATPGQEVVFWRRPGTPSEDLVLVPDISFERANSDDGGLDRWAASLEPVEVEWAPFEEAELVEIAVSESDFVQVQSGAPIKSVSFVVRVNGLLASRFGAGIQSGETKPTVGVESLDGRGYGYLPGRGDPSPESFSLEFHSWSSVGRVRLWFRLEGARAELGTIEPREGEVYEFEMPALEGWHGELHWPTLGQEHQSGSPLGLWRAIQLSSSSAPGLETPLRVLPGATVRPSVLPYGRYLFVADRMSEIVEIGPRSPGVITLSDSRRTLRVRLRWDDGRPLQGERFTLQVPGTFAGRVYSSAARQEEERLVFDSVPDASVELRFSSPRLDWFRQTIDVPSIAEGEVVDVTVPVDPQ